LNAPGADVGKIANPTTEDAAGSLPLKTARRPLKLASGQLIAVQASCISIWGFCAVVHNVSVVGHCQQPDATKATAVFEACGILTVARLPANEPFGDIDKKPYPSDHPRDNGRNISGYKRQGTRPPRVSSWISIENHQRTVPESESDNED
jgi:hypothetical protein